MRSSIRCGFAFLLASIGVGLFAFNAGSAGAHYVQSSYAFKPDYGCLVSGRTDPVTMVFYGKVDRPGGPYPIVSADVESMIEHAANWKVHTGGAQDGKSHGVCGPVDAQTASGYLTRFHVRLFANYDLDLKGRREVFATPHYEEFGTCGHAVASNTSNIRGSGFDQGRIQLTNLMVNDGYSIGDNQNWGNTQNFMQCNGDIAGSNGTVYWILTH